MPEVRGMRAVVQFLRQSAEPCAAQPTRPFMALLMEHRAVGAHARLPRCSAQRPSVLLTQDQGNQSVDLSRFPLLQPLFQLRVSVDTFRDFSEEQAASVAAKQGPGLSRLSAQAAAYRETTQRVSAIAEARRSSESNCLSRSVRTVFGMGHFGSGLSSKGSPGGHELHPDAQAAGGPERCPQHEVPEVVYCCCRNCTGCIAATVWRHRSRRPHGQDDAAARCFRRAIVTHHTFVPCAA